MQGAIGDSAHVGLFHVFRADAIKHFTVYANVLKGNVTAAAGAGGCTPRLPIMTKAMINMELVRRRTRIFLDIRPTFIFLIETKERLQR